MSVPIEVVTYDPIWSALCEQAEALVREEPALASPVHAKQAHAPSEITYAPGTPMWSQDPEREAVPVPGGARKAPV
jgi:hypothetical protein